MKVSRCGRIYFNQIRQPFTDQENLMICFFTRPTIQGIRLANNSSKSIVQLQINAISKDCYFIQEVPVL